MVHVYSARDIGMPPNFCVHPSCWLVSDLFKWNADKSHVVVAIRRNLDDKVKACWHFCPELRGSARSRETDGATSATVEMLLPRVSYSIGQRVHSGPISDLKN